MTMEKSKTSNESLISDDEYGLVMDMMAIPGSSGSEEKVVEYVIKTLENNGISREWIITDDSHHKVLHSGNTGNLILKFPGTHGGARRLLSAHMDTVPLCVGSKPIKQGRKISALGSSTALGADNRAACAVLLKTAIEVTKQNLDHPPLTFCWFIQEETGLKGSGAVTKNDLGNPELGFNWDGGKANSVVVGATGAYRIKIEITGLASHAGSAPEKGVSAIVIASRAIAKLEENGWHGKISKGDQTGTSNIGFISSGDATNVVPDRASLKVEARSHNPEFREQIVNEIQTAFKKAVDSVRNISGQSGEILFEATADYESYRLDLNEPSVQIASQAIENIGASREYVIADGGLDSNSLYLKGIPAVTLGVGQMNPHTLAESLNLDDYDLACRIALLIATGR